MKYNENYSVVILAGGLGTRLRSVVSDRSKVMTPVGGKPFLEYQFKYLQKYNINKVYLCVSYMKDSIMDYFGNNYNGISIEYLAEEQPLGTWGAVRNALMKIPNKYCIIFNGDSYCPVNIKELINTHQSHHNQIIVISKKADSEDYGQVIINDATNQLVDFLEKSNQCISPWVNAGIYVLSRQILEVFGNILKGSLEKDIFPNMPGIISCYKTGECIYDIGTPERLSIAENMVFMS